MDATVAKAFAEAAVTAAEAEAEAEADLTADSVAEETATAAEAAATARAAKAAMEAAATAAVAEAEAAEMARICTTRIKLLRTGLGPEVWGDTERAAMARPSDTAPWVIKDKSAIVIKLRLQTE